MAYYRGKDIEKSRGNAIKELIIEKRSVAQVARRFGKNRSTIYRWLKKHELMVKNYLNIKHHNLQDAMFAQSLIPDYIV